MQASTIRLFRIIFILGALLSLALGKAEAQIHNNVHDSDRVEAIYDIANYVKWPQQSDIDTFRLGLLSRDSALYRETVRQKDLRINEKPVNVLSFEEERTWRSDRSNFFSSNTVKIGTFLASES